jgi:hypothetical protein
LVTIGAITFLNPDWHAEALRAARQRQRGRQQAAAEGERGRMKVRRGMGGGSHCTTGQRKAAIARLGCLDVPLAFLRRFLRKVETLGKPTDPGSWKRLRVGAPLSKG